MKNLFYTLLIIAFAISTLPVVANTGVLLDDDFTSRHETTINSAPAEDASTPIPIKGDGDNLKNSRAEFIQSGSEYFTISSGLIGFGTGGLYPALPADFFGPGSDPFEGQINFIGANSNGSVDPNFDLQINRMDDVNFNTSFPDAQEVGLELVSLGLVSTDPIDLEIYSTESFFDVFVDLVIPGSGYQAITKENDYGGTFETEILFYPVFTFIEVDNPSNQVVYNPMDQGEDPVMFVSTLPYPWTHSPNANTFDPVAGEGNLIMMSGTDNVLTLEPFLVRSDMFMVAMDENGEPEAFEGTGFNEGTWYEYPNYEWWNVWFYDHPVDQNRKKVVTGSMMVEPRIPDMPSYVEIVFNWSTPDWPGYPELNRPPLPEDVQDPTIEDLFIGRSDPLLIYEDNIYEPIPIEIDWELLDFNPEWLSVDIRGYNYILTGNLQHVCFKDDSDSQLDFGDAPDQPYPTLLVNDGARHTVDGLTYLGASVDTEADGQPNASADGDDIANLDDEDGVTFLSALVAGTPAQVRITASTGGVLSAWIDFDQNGSWSEAGNQIFTDKMLVAGDNMLTFLVPVGANTGSTYARFRFSSQQMGLTYKGPAENGEVEDYKVEVIENQSIKWIQYPDTEFYGYHAHQQEGPDLWIADDWQCEGGLVTDLHWWGYYEMPASGPCNGFRISIYDNDSSGPYNKPGTQILTWDAPFGTNPGEVGEYFTGKYAISGDELNYYNFDLPEPFAQIEGNFYWLELMALSADQQNNVLWEWQTNGEPIVLSDPIQFDESGYQGLLDRNMAFIITSQPEGIDNYDFGDAPNGPYPTLLVNDGARHFIDGSTFLGNNVDAEPDGLPNINATGDDLNNIYDEDGVTFITPFVVGKTAEVKIRASKNGLLNAWIDFNLNGSWAESNEHIFTDHPLIAGLNTLTFNIPSTGKPGVSYIRFRFDSNGGLNYYGSAENGEVEDYKLIIYPPDWKYTPTGSSHIISVPKLVSFNCLTLSAGDFLGTFYTDENGNLACGGAAVWDGINNQTVVAFGDDITTTPLKEGFAENEEFLWKAYFSSTGVEEEVLATYNPVFPNSDGKFHDNGISGLTSLIKKMNVLASANPTTICAGDAVQLNALVYGGCGTNTFSWTSNPVGFTSSLQNPSAMPDQSTTFTVTVTNTYGDSDTATVNVMVNPLPEPTCPDDFEICIDEGPVTLSGGLPIGGTYSGTGVTAGVFYPYSAGAGSHTITYTYVEPGTNCAGSCEFMIIVNPLPVMDCPPYMEACEDDPQVLLNTGYPLGGVYTGTGVSFDGTNYFFDPGIGAGTYIINYCFTDSITNCENCCEFNFYVHAKPDVSCPEDFTICYDTAPFTLSGGLPTGGTYSGTGVSGGMFYPATAGVGSHVITYTYVDPQTFCENFCTFKITVILVEATCPDDFEICIDEGPVTLSGGLPIGGSYSGTGVTGGVFYPGTAGAGDHIITYTYVEPGTNCSGSCEFMIIVNPLPVMDCPPFLEACEDDPQVLLNTSYPLGGVYTGTGVSFDGANYFFDPAIGPGTYIINYCFTNPDTDCENCCEFNFYVYAKPQVSCPEDFTICYDTAPFTLSGGLPTGGTYSGTGVSGGMFNPATAGVGTHLISYTYIDPQTLCENFCTFKITVILVEATCPDDFEICIDEGPVTLSGGLPIGGSYSGTGVTGGVFYPGTAGAGDHIITYTYVEPGTNCSGSCDFKITVNSLPVMDCPPFMEACEDDPQVLLNTSTPAGGEYTGTGVYFDGSDYFFDPAIGPGTYIILYCFTDANTACENCCEFNFNVYAKPDVTCPEDFTICYDTAPFALSEGLPTGGTYSGAGVSGGMFYPATAGVGTHLISYTYIDPQTLCEDFCTFKITVILVEATCPDDFEICIDEGPVTLSGGLPISGTYSGTGVTGGVFYPYSAGAGSHIITYTYFEPGTNCSDSCEFMIIVNPLPVMDCPAFMEACEDDPPVLLNNSYPQGGDYTGTGVFFDGYNYFFDPGVGFGIYVLNYCFTNPATGCENCCEYNFIVHAKPDVFCPEDFAVCLDTPADTLSGGLPVGGQYSGDGVSFDGTNYWFDPSVAGEGAHEVLYVYTNPQTLCSNMCSFIITVIEVPEVMCPDDMMVCINDNAFELTGATPEGGTYSGPGVSGGFFNPSAAGVGTHVITYTVGVAGTNCFGQCEFEITVKPLPGVDCPGDMEICLYSPTILLDNASPPGGTYSGEGVFYENGFYYFDPSVAVGEYEITYCVTDSETGCINCCTYIITVVADQVVSIPEGWSGVSSYIEPDDTDMNLILYPITYQLTILSNNEGIYWPGGNTFTLTDWDVYSGYVIKVSEDAELPFCGMELVEKTIELNQGWNIIPVLTSYPYSSETLFHGVEGFEIAKDVAGTGVFWEEYGINTMPVLDPGKAYYVRMSSAGNLTFNLPLDEMPSFELNKPSELRSPWNEIINTPGSHTIVFNTSELALEQGDVIGGFTPEGQCAGVVEIEDINNAFTLNLNGDDALTSVKEGFDAGEHLSYKLYRATTGETFELTVSYNHNMNTGQFEVFGLSEITSLKLSATGIFEVSEDDVVIYPNPSNGIFNIEGISATSSLVIFNAFGEEIMSNELIRKGTIDISDQPNGVYFVRIKTTNESFVKKLVKE